MLVRAKAVATRIVAGRYRSRAACVILVCLRSNNQLLALFARLTSAPNARQDPPVLGCWRRNPTARRGGWAAVEGHGSHRWAGALHGRLRWSRRSQSSIAAHSKEPTWRRVDVAEENTGACAEGVVMHEAAT